MQWTEEKLRERLRGETIRNGECAKRGFEIARLLTGQTDTPPDPREKSVDAALEMILGAAKEGGIVITWFESGYVAGNGVQHCYFVFDDAPMKSFTIWEDGLEFLDEAKTLQKLVTTIERDGEIGIHAYPMSSTNAASLGPSANLPNGDPSKSPGA